MTSEAVKVLQGWWDAQGSHWQYELIAVAQCSAVAIPWLGWMLFGPK